MSLCNCLPGHFNAFNVLLQVASASHTSLWLKHVDFRLGESSNCLDEQSQSLKRKYTVLRPPEAVKHLKVKLNGHAITTATGSDDSLPKPKRYIESESKVVLEWHEKRAIGAGLGNLGNTCFMNSVLQCLTYCPPLVNYLLYQENDHSNRKCVTFCMACLLASHVKKCYDLHGQSFQPISIYNKLRSIAKSFRPGRQEDAHEYLRHVIDSMCRQSIASYEAKIGMKLDASSKETTIWNHIFGGYLRSQVTCHGCSTKSNTFDHFMDFMLDIKNVTTLERALERFTSPESLADENAYKCPKCKKKCPATKRFTVFKPPNVATIQLKRFEYNRFFGGKITKHITFPEILNLRPYMSESTGEKVIYKLNSVLVHLGGSCNSGHYYSYVRNSRDTWYQMDDSRVTSVGLNHVLNQNAYVLFYLRISPSTPSSTVTPATPTPNDSISRSSPVFKFPLAVSTHSQVKLTTISSQQNGNATVASTSTERPAINGHNSNVHHSNGYGSSNGYTNGNTGTNGPTIIPVNNNSNSSSNNNNNNNINRGQNGSSLQNSTPNGHSQVSSSHSSSTSQLESNVHHSGQNGWSVENDQSLTTVGTNVLSWSGDKNSLDSQARTNSSRENSDDGFDPELDRGKVRVLTF